MKYVFTQATLFFLCTQLLTAQTEKVGIGTTTPSATLDVNGDLKIGSGTNETPPAGTVRWNDETGDFEGYNGSEWKSLTRRNAFGNTIAYENQAFQGNGNGSAFRKGIGFSIAISGNIAVVGDPFDTEQGFDAGAAWVYEFEGGRWNLVTKLLASDGDAGDQFGWSVDISGDFIIVGAPHDDDAGTEAGSAYIFYNFSGINWIEPDKLLPSDPEDFAHFGESVSISGVYALVGAPDRDLTAAEAGAAYIFKKDQFTNNFSETAQFQPVGGDADMGDKFGYSVDLSGERALIAALNDDEAASNAGAAYIFQKTIGELWSQSAKLTASDAEINDAFGTSVSLSGDYALIGALAANKAYVFNTLIQNVWNEQAILVPSVDLFDSNFGSSVAISDNIAIVGAERHTFQFGNQGSAWVFERSGGAWAEVSQLIAADAGPNDQYGQAVSIEAGRILVGAPNASSDDDGRVYSYH